jgi:hypothetical protein
LKCPKAKAFFFLKFLGVETLLPPPPPLQKKFIEMEKNKKLSPNESLFKGGSPNNRTYYLNLFIFEAQQQTDPT